MLDFRVFYLRVLNSLRVQCCKCNVSVRFCRPWARVIFENRNEITFKGRVNAKIFVAVSCFERKTNVSINSGELYENGSKPPWYEYMTFANDFNSFVEGIKKG